MYGTDNYEKDVSVDDLCSNCSSRYNPERCRSCRNRFKGNKVTFR